MSLEIVFPSFAKVNLFLEVTGKRADGYHNLFTLFQTVSLHDRVRLIERPGAREVWFSDPSIDPERNTVTKVLDLLGIREGLRVEVEKRIPSGGGLGGGSSNAGSVLLALNAHRNLRLSKGRLWEIASAVGADVPFFLFGGRAIGMGRGDILFPQEDGEKQYLVLNCPGVSLSTARIFSDLTEFGEMSRIYALFINGEGKRFVNRLEEPAFRIHPRLREEKAKMAEKSDGLVLMTGSGSTLFALFSDITSARGFASSDPKLKIVETLGRREYYSQIGASPSGKASDFGSDIRRFESSRPSEENP